MPKNMGTTANTVQSNEPNFLEAPPIGKKLGQLRLRVSFFPAPRDLVIEVKTPVCASLWHVLSFQSIVSVKFKGEPVVSKGDTSRQSVQGGDGLGDR